MQQALLGIVPPPVLEIGEAGRPLAGLVVDVGADVGAVGIARIEGERALDGGERAIDLAGLDLGEGDARW